MKKTFFTPHDFAYYNSFSKTYIIIWCTQKIAVKVGIPRQAITLFCMTFESNIWTALSTWICKGNAQLKLNYLTP